MSKFNGHYLLIFFLIIIITISHHFVHTETKIKKFMLIGEDGQKLMLMKAIALNSLTSSEDNQIYHIKPQEWPYMERKQAEGKMEKEKNEYGIVAVKIVRMLPKDYIKRKRFETLTHEVDMLWLAKANACQHVVQLFEAHIAKNTVYMVMELGDQTLDKGIEQFGKKWAEDQEKNVITMDIHETMMDMVKALVEFHKFGVHFALKPANWLYFNGRLKLIDLQTALAVDKNGKTIEIRRNYIYICKSLESKGDINHDAVLQSYSSPEHKKFCRAITKYGKNIDPNGLTTSADIWSFGVVVCKILIATPQIQSLISQKKWPDEWQTPNKLLHLYGVISKSMMNLNSELEEWQNEEQKNAAKIIAREFMATVEETFPHIYTLLINVCEEKMSVFLSNPNARSTADEIQKYLENITKLYEKEKKWPEKDESRDILKELLSSKKFPFDNVEWEKNAKFVIEEVEEEFHDEESSKNAFHSTTHHSKIHTHISERNP